MLLECLVAQAAAAGLGLGQLQLFAICFLAVCGLFFFVLSCYALAKETRFSL